MSQATEPVPELIDGDTAAAMLGVSRPTLYKLARLGRVPPPIKLGASTRWGRRALLAWIDQGCPTQAEASAV